MSPCPAGQVTAVRLDELGDHFRRYRLRVPQAVQAMAQSLRRWGQCAAIVATVRRSGRKCSMASPAGRRHARCAG